MSSEIVLSSYILRLSKKHNDLRIGLHNIRTGTTKHFTTMEGLIQHLAVLQDFDQALLESLHLARAPPNFISTKKTRLSPNRRHL